MVTLSRGSLHSAIGASLIVATALLAGCSGDTPEQVMAKARAALSQNDLKSAEIHLKNLLQAKPDDTEGRLLLGALHQTNRDHRSAEKEWRRALELGASPDRALPQLMQALTLTGEYKRALEAADAWKATEPAARAAVHYWTGRAQHQLGQRKESEASFRAALGAQPDYGLAQTALIGLQAARGEIDGAHKALDELLLREPRLAEALVLKADLLSARGDLDGSRSLLQRAIEAKPDHVEAHIRLVTLLTDQKDYPAATTAHAALRKLAPGALLTQHLQAVLDFRQNRLDAARDGAAQVLKSNPEFLPAVALAANVALVQNQLELAERLARQLAVSTPASLNGVRLLAAVHLRKNEPDRALQLTSNAIARGVKDAALYSLAGEAALRGNRFNDAARYFEQAATLAPDDPSKRIGRGIALIATGRSDAGFADLEAAASADGASTQADLALISARIRAKQYDQALAAIDRLEKRQPEAPLPHHLRGTVLVTRGDHAGGRAAFQRALQQDAGYLPSAIGLAQLDLRDRKPEDARQRLESITTRNPRNVQAWLALAELVARTGGTRDDVVKLLKQAQAANPSAPEPVLVLSRHYLQAGQPREAITLLQQSLSQQPENTDLLDALGNAFVRADERQQALDAFEKVVRINPRSVTALLRLGDVRAAMNDNPGALGAYRQAAAIDPKAAQVQFRIAAALLRDGKRDEARKVAQALQKESPNDPAGLSLEGDLNAADGKWLEAASSYRKANALLRSPQTTAKLHQALLRANKPADAEAALREGLKALPGDVALRMYAGDRAMADNQWKSAVDHYDAVVTISPSNVIALNNLAWSLMQINDPRAVKVAEDAVARAPNAPAVVDTLGVVLVANGQTQRGLESLRQAIKLAPKAPEFRLHLVQALVRTGDKSGARLEIDALVRDFPDSPQAKAARTLAGGL